MSFIKLAVYGHKDDENEYMPIVIGDVVYENNTALFNEEFKELIEILITIFPKLYDDPTAVDFGAIFGPIATSFPRFKHQGFREEQEVRIVAAPVTAGLRDYIKGTEPDYKTKPLKQIHALGAGSFEKKYIKLYDFQNDHPGLPILRIIVGPHRDQREHERQARKIVKGMGIKIVCSKTPYIGRK